MGEGQAVQDPSPARARRDEGRGPSRVTWREPLLALTAVVLFFALLESVLALLGVDPVVGREDPFVGFARGAPLFVPEADGRGEESFRVTAPDKRGHFNLQRFASTKAEGTSRVFCLGGSTTYGRPYDDETSFAGWLRALLPVAAPDRAWEVVNAGGISYASYRVAELMKELVDYDPDLFVIYTGHNEFLEERTYGGVRKLPGWIGPLAGVAAKTRTWTAMSSLIEALRPAGSETSDPATLLPSQVAAKLDRAAGLDLYERDDELSRNVLLHFELSLERMVEIAREVGARVVFVVPASNLADFSPFKSQPTDGLGEEAQRRSVDLLASARRSLARARWQEALAALDEARSIDPRFAETHYLRGRALLALGRGAEARRAFERAADEDVCPLRALSEIEETVRRVARRTGAPLVDFAALLETRSRAGGGSGVPGDDFFLDHVHPTIEGNRLLAVALIEELAEVGIVPLSETWGEATIERVAEAVEGGLDPADHASGLGNAAVVLDWAGKKQEAARLARRAVESGVEEPKSLAILARDFAVRGEAEQSLRHFRRSLLADPTNPLTRFHLALALLGRGEPRRAASHLLYAIAQWPENPRFHLHFGMLMADLGRDDLALASVARASSLEPGSSVAAEMMARIRARLGGRAEEVGTPVLAVSQHRSGALRTISQVVRGGDGEILRVGVETEWDERGLPSRYAEYRDGLLDGIVVTWDSEGAVVARESYEGGASAALGSASSNRDAERAFGADGARG